GSEGQQVQDAVEGSPGARLRRDQGRQGRPEDGRVHVEGREAGDGQATEPARDDGGQPDGLRLPRLPRDEEEEVNRCATSGSGGPTRCRSASCCRASSTPAGTRSS